MKSPAKSPVANARGRAFDRHSGSGSRGLPKKNGAGGKGVWGAEMDQEGVACLDKNDPNYDSDEDTSNNAPPQFTLTPPNPNTAEQPIPTATTATTSE